MLENQTSLTQLSKTFVASPYLGGNEKKYVLECLDENWISSKGKFLHLFEKSFSQFSGCRHGVSVSNGTVALHLALMALDIGPGDEVIVPDLTFGATMNAVIHSGATPVLVDVDKDSWGLDPEKVKKALSSKTKAIMPVHLYGRPAKMNELMKIAFENKLKVVEDCAEAPGARVQDNVVGSFGDIGCFSFFGNKILTTGEGGMCVTNSSSLEEKMKTLRDHGMSKDRRYWHCVVGMNYRMTNIQAAIGLAQMEQVESFFKKRNEIQAFYEKSLKGFISFQKSELGTTSVPWLVTGLLKKSVNRDKLIQSALKKGVELRPFFYPLSDMDLFKNYSKEMTINAHEISYRGICLPTSVSLTKDQLERVVKVIKSFLKEDEQ